MDHCRLPNHTLRSCTNGACNIAEEDALENRLALADRPHACLAKLLPPIVLFLFAELLPLLCLSMILNHLVGALVHLCAKLCIVGIVVYDQRFLLSRRMGRSVVWHVKVEEVLDAVYSLHCRCVCVVEFGLMALLPGHFTKGFVVRPCVLEATGNNMPSQVAFRIDERLDHQCYRSNVQSYHEVRGSAIQVSCSRCLEDEASVVWLQFECLYRYAVA